jgi:hypothetical protein
MLNALLTFFSIKTIFKKCKSPRHAASYHSPPVPSSVFFMSTLSSNTLARLRLQGTTQRVSTCYRVVQALGWLMSRKKEAETGRNPRGNINLTFLRSADFHAAEEDSHKVNVKKCTPMNSRACGTHAACIQQLSETHMESYYLGEHCVYGTVVLKNTLKYVNWIYLAQDRIQ